MSAILEKLEAEKDAKLHMLVGSVEAAVEDGPYDWALFKDEIGRRYREYATARDAYRVRLQQECGWLDEQLQPEQDDD